MDGSRTENDLYFHLLDGFGLRLRGGYCAFCTNKISCEWLLHIFHSVLMQYLPPITKLLLPKTLPSCNVRTLKLLFVLFVFNLFIYLFFSWSMCNVFQFILFYLLSSWIRYWACCRLR